MAFMYEDKFTFKLPDPNRLDTIAYWDTPANTQIILMEGNKFLALLPVQHTEGTTTSWTVPYDTTNNVYTVDIVLPKTFETSEYHTISDLICIEDITNNKYVPYVDDLSKVDGTTLKAGWTFDSTTNKITVENKTGADFSVQVYYIPAQGMITLQHKVRTPSGIAERKIAGATCSEMLTRDIARNPITISLDATLTRGHSLELQVLPRRLNGTPLFKFTPFDSQGNVLPILQIEIEYSND